MKPQFGFAKGAAEVQFPDDMHTMTNVSPMLTGLPFVVWISRRKEAHDIRVRVSRIARVIPGQFISVALRPDVEVVEGYLRPSELDGLREWVGLNWDVLLAYWDGYLPIGSVLARLHAVRLPETAEAEPLA